MTIYMILPKNTKNKHNTPFVLEIFWNLWWARHLCSPDNKDSQIMYQIYFQGCSIIINILLHVLKFILLDKCTGPVPDLSQILNGHEYIGFWLSSLWVRMEPRQYLEVSLNQTLASKWFFFFFKDPLEKQHPLSEQNKTPHANGFEHI